MTRLLCEGFVTSGLSLLAPIFGTYYLLRDCLVSDWFVLKPQSTYLPIKKCVWSKFIANYVWKRLFIFVIAFFRWAKYETHNKTNHAGQLGLRYIYIIQRMNADTNVSIQLHENSSYNSLLHLMMLTLD